MMSKEEMAVAILNEMLEDLADIKRRLLQFADRFSRYGKEHVQHCPDDKLAEIYAACDDFAQAMAQMGKEIDGI